MLTCPACERSFDRRPGDGIPAHCSHCASRVVGVYCDLNLIGSGAMGDVYQARRPNMGNRTVAIKIPRDGEPRVCSRFEREIAASAQLRHENIVCAFDRGEEEGRPYLVMEYVAGRSLGDLVDAEHPLSPAEVARIVRQVAAGLAHAALHRIVNRDIKPDNILIANDGTAKILDYGLALIHELEGPADRVTRNGTLLGTPSFLAPEQAVDPRGVSIAADIYALGCTAYYALTKRAPFSAKDSFGLLRQHAEAPRPGVRAKRPDVDEDFDKLIQRMMAVLPKDRPSPKELMLLLDSVLPHLSNARPSMSAPVAGMIDVRCPGCQKVYHLRSDMIGKQFKCPNKMCARRFNVEAPLGATISMSKTLPDGATPVPPELGMLLGSPPTEPLEAEPVDAEPVDAEPLEAEAIDAEPVEAEPVEAEAVDAEPVEAESIEDETTIPPTQPVFANYDIPPIQGGFAPQVAEPEPEVAVAKAEEVAPEPAEVETVQGFAASIPTPVEVALGEARPVEPIEPPPVVGAAELPPVQWAARDDRPELPPVQTGSAQAMAAPPVPPRQESAAKGRPAPAKARPKGRGRAIAWVAISMIFVMLLVSGFAGWKVYEKLYPTPDKQWDIARQAFQNKRWDVAVAEFKKFEKDYPDDPRAEEIPFFLSMSEVGEQVFNDGSSAEACLDKMEGLFREYRDQPVYKLYPADLYSFFQKLVERFTEEANVKLDVAKIEKARTAFNLLSTIAESMEDTWVPENIAKYTTYMDETEAKVRTRRGQKDALELVKLAQGPELSLKPDEMYAKMAALEKTFPELLNNKEYLAERDNAYRAEPKRVRYRPIAEEDLPVWSTASEPAGQNLFIVWDGRQGSTTAIHRRQVVTALSRGVLYVFDPQGNFLWARRLGIDADRLPLHVPATATSPDALVAVSTEDNTLVSLQADNQRVLWQYHAEGDISSPLTVVDVPGGRNQPDKKRGLLPTTDGEAGYINVLELVMGKQLGRYEIGHPLAPVGGGYDKHNRLAYFPADSQRVFAINPLAIDSPEKEPACKAVLFTNHVSGALRSEPTLVDRATTGSPEVYMIMAEANELEQMKLRVFDLNETRLKDPHSPPIKETPLDGWSWFSPLATPDRITLVTDSGALGVLGLNLDNPSEALYWVIKPEAAKLPVRDRFRALAVDSDERYLWVMAGGALQKLKLDVLGQQTRRLWPTDVQAAEVTGVPLHEAQLDDRGEVLFLGLMASDGGHFDFMAVDSKAGHKLWQRQLGVKLFGDPLPVGQKVLVIDHSGRTLLLDPDNSEAIYQPSSEFSLPPGGDPQKIIRIRSDQGNPYLALPLADGKQLALAHLDGSQDGPLVWEIIPLAEALQGRPCICGDFLVIPGAEGTLRRHSLKAGVSVPINEQPVDWMPGPVGISKKPGPQRAALFPLGPASILLVAAGRDVRSMEIRDEGNVTSWQQIGGSFESEAPLIGQVLIYRDRALVVDENGKVYAFKGADPGDSRGIWSLGGKPTGEPFLRGDKLLAVVDGRKLVAIAPDAPNENGEPLWASEPFNGRIRGQPVVSGNLLLVTDESRRVTALNLADGKAAWTVRLPARIGPCAAAVPFGDDRILVPLSDGTFQVLPRPISQPGGGA